MGIPRFYCPGTIFPGAEIPLPEAAGHHALRVLRLKPGDAAVVFNGDGGEYSGRISRAGRQGVSVTALEQRDAGRESPLQVRLVQGLCGADKMDWLLEKATELGVAAVQPVAASRSVVKLSGERAEKRLAHWQGVVISACEQCGRNRLPQLTPLLPFAAWLEAEPRAATDELGLLLAPQARQGLSALPRPGGRVTLLVGPEGGFSDEEQALAVRSGFLPVRLGARILRTETVALAALAAMQALWGDY